MLASEIGRGVIEREEAMGWPGGTGPADSAIFATENGRCIADEMAMLGCRWTPADKRPGSRVQGWEKMRTLMRQAGTELPGLFVFATCRQIIRTLPTLPRDQAKPDDVDSDAEDHIADAMRYRVHNAPQQATVVVAPWG